MCYFSGPQCPTIHCVPVAFMLCPNSRLHTNTMYVLPQHAVLAVSGEEVSELCCFILTAALKQSGTQPQKKNKLMPFYLT